MNNKPLIITVVATIVLIAGISVALVWSKDSRTAAGAPDELQSLATCLTEHGAKFYGAFWCPHCQNQKKAFGDAASLLPYVECASLSGNDQTQACRDAGIESYPTWIFANGERHTGEQPLAELAALADCPAPSGAVAGATTNTEPAPSLTPPTLPESAPEATTSATES